jgi:hypothetical protein
VVIAVIPGEDLLNIPDLLLLISSRVRWPQTRTIIEILGRHCTRVLLLRRKY